MQAIMYNMFSGADIAAALEHENRVTKDGLDESGIGPPLTLVLWRPTANDSQIAPLDQRITIEHLIGNVRFSH
jgi:hypothetical protein